MFWVVLFGQFVKEELCLGFCLLDEVRFYVLGR